MKWLCVLLIFVMVVPIGPKAQDTALAVNMNVGAHYGDDVVAMEFMIHKTLGGGAWELGIMGDIGKGEHDNSAGVMTGVNLIEGPSFVLGLIKGWKYTVSDNVDYLTGTRGLYMAYRPPWSWDAKIYGLWRYDFATPEGFSVEQGVAIDGTHKFGLGVSLPIR